MYVIISQKRIVDYITTFDLIGLAISALIVIPESYVWPLLLKYGFCFLICFISVKLILVSVVLNLNIVKQYKKHFLLVAIIMVAAFGAVAILTKRNSSGALEPITTEEFYQLKENLPNNRVIIYIGKPNCNACRQAQPKIEEILSKNGLSGYYYNTQDARVKNEDQMLELMDDYSIIVVPSIIFLYDDGKVETITGNNVVDKFENLI